MPRNRSSWFLSKRWRPQRFGKWPFYVLTGLELALTIALLALFGIASPNTYRSRLWQDGADNGFNSSPLLFMYAAANYRPYTTPMIWSQFLTNYNLVIVILSMFLMLCKSTMYIVSVFPPILSVVLHAALIALYSTSVYYQLSKDMSDPKRPQNGPPWYITKSCSVASNPDNVQYCTQAKAAFGASTTLLGIFVIYFGLAVWSCLPSKAHREEVAIERKERDEKYSRLEAAHEEAKAANPAAFNIVPETPGLQNGMHPMTPRTHAFNKLDGNPVPVSSSKFRNPLRTKHAINELNANQNSTPSRTTHASSEPDGDPVPASSSKISNLLLRTHFSSPNRPTSPRESVAPQSGMRSPGHASFKERAAAQSHVQSDAGDSTSPRAQAVPQPGDPMYFPPPPKKSNKK